MASSSTNKSAGSSKTTQGLTSLMQDRQARNKPLLNFDEDEASDVTKSRHLSFEVVERRRKAATILDSPELLMTYANALGDTIPSTRQRMTKILCGYEDSSTETLWGGLKTSRVPKPPGSTARVGRMSRSALRSSGYNSTEY